MRLFIAIEVPDTWRMAAAELRRAITQRRELRLRWVTPEQLHLTLRFLGEVDEATTIALQRALDTKVTPVDLTLALGTPGTFGGPRRTTTAWAGIEGDLEPLAALAARIDAAVAGCGLAVEPRAFTPHLTLARLPRGASAAERRAAFEAFDAAQAPPPATVRASSVALVRSHLGRDGARYEVLSRHR